MRDTSVSLAQMREHADEAIRLAESRSRSDLDSDRVLGLALARLLEILGEAASRIPAEFKADHPDIAWQGITGLRNRLIHAYDEVDYDIVWEIIVSDLPVLVDQLDAIGI